MAQFADDTQFFLDSKKSVNQVIQTLTDIEANIGLKVNYEKLSIHCIAGMCPFKCNKSLVWDPGGLQVLGIEIMKNPQSNYMSILKKCESVYTNWYNRQLSLTGKTMIVNTFVSSLFTYVMQVEEDPDEAIVKEFYKLTKNFIWNGNEQKLKWSCCRQKNYWAD